MKKLLILILVVFMGLSVGCSNNAEGENNADSDTEGKTAVVKTQTPVSDEEILQMLQATNEIPDEYKSSTINEGGSVSEYAIDHELSTISQYSSNIVKATIKSVEYFTYQNMAWSKFELSVIDSYRGDIQPNQTISLVTQSGYINAAEKLEGTEEKDGTKIDWDTLKKQVNYEYSSENKPPVVGNTYMFFLKQQDRKPFNGAYGSTRGDASRVLFVEQNGIFVVDNSTSEKTNLTKYSEDDILKIIEQNQYNGKANF